MVDYAILGIESMSVAIENPFGYHKNCIDLCAFCKGITANVLEILNRSEHVERAQILEYEEVMKMNNELSYEVPCGGDCMF